MHSFQWTQSALGIIVALGMTRIIMSVVQACVSRRQVRLDWIPFVWAFNIFFLLLQFSWNFVELEAIVVKWNFGIFLLLLGFVITLFFAAALILPISESQAGGDLSSWFRNDGRWALPFLALYAFLAYPFNWYLAELPPSSNPASMILIILAMTAFFTRSRKILVIATVLNFLLTSAIIVEMIASS
ncbi:hypothetical protein ICN42_10650 [Polynucleobacter sp. 71A-WALBACH]|uniref:hypothetical protein n=1 Tax=Polynucleobacter sp. 71A-WALBACH TaxID=2689097 RepID=UPI001C0D73E8|nr:hypothetical protein [Polynucleobacter sp. 71A-WALBACH]MBU3594548.1 hypothetical protein [Polynucleobacter sp. 71A-WALBACH]